MATSGSDLEFYMLDLINQERAAVGASALRLEQNLNEAAEDHSQWMIDSNVFSHTGAGGSSAKARMEAADFVFSGNWRSGENIGFQSERGAPGLFDDVEDIHERLMNSSGHRANILRDDFEYIGIGIEFGNHAGFNGVMITQNFAKTSAPVILDGENPSAAAPPPPPPPPPLQAIVAPPAPPSPNEISGSSGKDVLSGTAGDDIIRGRDGNDVLDGGAGDDVLRGGNGNDWLRGGEGADEFRGGKGVDVADYHGVSQSVVADLQYEASNSGAAAGDVYISIAWLRGTSNSDQLRGNEWDNQLRGGSGNDILNGRDGEDTLFGGNGNDVLRGGEGDDMLYGMSGNDRFVFEDGMGADVVHDFDDNRDTLDFRAMTLGSLDAVMALAEQQGSDVFFDLGGGDSLTIADVTRAQLENDILF